MSQDFILLPQPRQLELNGSQFFKAPATGLIALDSFEAQEIYPSALLLQDSLDQQRLHWEIIAGKAIPGDQIAASLMVVPGSIGHREGYDLTITANGIYVVAEAPAGVFYAVQTLKQIIRQVGLSIPALRCRDWPDFSNRGIMLDISRDKVPTMDTLFKLIDLFASWKVNQLQLYTEHTFAYRNHPVVWANASPMTGEEILALDAFCRERFIELVPNQNTFGHMRPWLIHAEYRHLAECPDGCDTRWGRFDQPFSLSPTQPGSIELVRSLLNELLPHFSSRQVNIGGDEPVDLEMAQGRSGDLIKKVGVGRVYLDFLMKIYQAAKARGHTVQFWGDIIMEFPELVPELPRDMIALEWGYEESHPFDEHGALFAASGIPLYVCPGTSSWRAIAGRTDNAIGNLQNAARNGLNHGAVGYLITDWGDEGHWQPLSVSYLGFAYGSALAWSYKTNIDLDIRKALDIFVFQDADRIMGRLAYDLGNIYQAPGVLEPNSSVLFNALQASPQQIREYLASGTAVNIDQFNDSIQGTLKTIDAVIARLPFAKMECQDADLIREEFRWAADMLTHACNRILWVIDQEQQAVASKAVSYLASQTERLASEYHDIWHARNRPGGYQDSVARLRTMQSHYKF